MDVIKIIIAVFFGVLISAVLILFFGAIVLDMVNRNKRKKEAENNKR